MKSLHDDRGWDIGFMCRTLGISRASYYKWLGSKPSAREVQDALILAKIRDIAKSNNSLFGVLEMQMALRAAGFQCGHNRVYRLMCVNGIVSSYRPRRKRGWRPSEPEVTAENVLARDFNADAPNRKWCTDVTEIAVPGTGTKLYISPMLDLYDRFPVAPVVSERNDSRLALDTLSMAHGRYPDATPIVHSDRGSSYTSASYNAMLGELGMGQSMSRPSKCIDNGVCEGFQGQFKDMLRVLYPKISGKDEMVAAINGTLDYFVNSYPQKRLGGKTIAQARAEAMSASIPVRYEIKKAGRYIRYWDEINLKKKRMFEQMKKEEGKSSSV